jgi:hypothetical protein
LNTGRIELAKDRLFHCDVLRAAKILSDVPGATMEEAAALLKECRSRGGGAEAALKSGSLPVKFCFGHGLECSASGEKLIGKESEGAKRFGRTLGSGS